jgi:hypothetical protein
LLCYNGFFGLFYSQWLQQLQLGGATDGDYMKAISRDEKFTAVFEIPLVQSPDRAVRISMVADAKKGKP